MEGRKPLGDPPTPPLCRWRCLVFWPVERLFDPKSPVDALLPAEDASPSRQRVGAPWSAVRQLTGVIESGSAGVARPDRGEQA